MDSDENIAKISELLLRLVGGNHDGKFTMAFIPKTSFLPGGIIYRCNGIDITHPNVHVTRGMVQKGNFGKLRAGYLFLEIEQ